MSSIAQTFTIKLRTVWMLGFFFQEWCYFHQEKLHAPPVRRHSPAPGPCFSLLHDTLKSSIEGHREWVFQKAIHLRPFTQPMNAPKKMQRSGPPLLCSMLCIHTVSPDKSTLKNGESVVAQILNSTALICIRNYDCKNMAVGNHLLTMCNPRHIMRIASDTCPNNLGRVMEGHSVILEDLGEPTASPHTE